MQTIRETIRVRVTNNMQMKHKKLFHRKEIDDWHRVKNELLSACGDAISMKPNIKQRESELTISTSFELCG